MTCEFTFNKSLYQATYITLVIVFNPLQSKNNQIPFLIVQYQNLVAAGTCKLSITKANTTAKPIIIFKNNVTTMAEPNRITLPDMVTVARHRPVQHVQPDNRRAQNRTISRNVTIEPKSSSTLPDESVISVSSVHDVKPTADKESSTLPDLTIDQLQELLRFYFPPFSKQEKGSQYDKPGITSDEDSKEDESEEIILRDEGWFYFTFSSFINPKSSNLSIKSASLQSIIETATHTHILTHTRKTRNHYQ